MHTPLAEKLRPKDFDEFVGQEHITGKDGIVRKLLRYAKETGAFPSLIFWGPPGTGKTTLARIIATKLDSPFFEFSAVNTSIKDIEKVIPKSQHPSTQLGFGEMPLNNTQPPIVFIDEIHRFNKAQQDTLLPHVEKGNLILIGATTENPSFEVISPLLSRTSVLVLKQLEEIHLQKIAKRACEMLKIELTKNALSFLSANANGDARILLNVLEIATTIIPARGPLTIQLGVSELEQAFQKKQLSFDLKGEEYYNTISALHKSIRGSDPDAALYYLARMLEAGQDPLYIARRLIRAASEDIGLADPQALILANSAFEACNKLGMPECNVILAEIVVYLAKAPKSNALYVAYGEAVKDVYEHRNLPIPMHIRNAETKLMKEIGYGKDYDYFHSPKGEKKEGIEYLPEKLKGKKYLNNKIKP